MVEPIDEVKSTTPPEPPPAAPHTAANAADKVFLSEAAQVTLLSQQGLSLTEIADELDITLNVVLQDLGITATN
jgi:DNA-binding NarL/FixJ family response regulator